mgnify:CR=1 FL=1
MRQFGGSEALPDLTELLDDNEPQVQREAVRAILNIGTDAAYRILEQALAGGTDAVARRDHAVDRPGARRAGDAAVRLHPRAHRSSRRARCRSTCARSSRSARCATRAASRRCATRSTRASGGRRARTARAARAPRPRRWRASARPTRSRVLDEAVARGIARRPLGRARAARHIRARAVRRAPRGEATHERARVSSSPTSCSARFAASLRSAQLYSPGHPIIGAQPRVAVGRVPDAARPAADGHHRPGRRRSDRRRHADGQGRHARPVRPPAAAGGRRADHHRPRRHARRRSPTFLAAITTIDARTRRGGARRFPTIAHIRVGRVTVEQRVEGSLHRHGDDQAALQRRRLGRPATCGQRRRPRGSPTPPPRAR